MTGKFSSIGKYLAIALVGVGLVAAAYAAVKVYSVPKNVAIEAYIAPPLLFPEDGEYPEGAARLYKPFPVHASPDGKLVGHVHTNYATCNAECKGHGATGLVMLDGRRIPLKPEQWGYATMGLVTFEPSVIKGKAAWSKVLYEGGEFWITTPKKDIHQYEPMVQRVADFDTLCTKPGKCEDVSEAMSKQMNQLSFHSCFTEAYNVTRIVTADGERYYQVALAEFERPAFKVTLPRKAFVPVRNKDGKHTGVFDPMGC
jgi:hypothetical protein